MDQKNKIFPKIVEEVVEEVKEGGKKILRGIGRLFLPERKTSQEGDKEKAEEKNETEGENKNNDNGKQGVSGFTISGEQREANTTAEEKDDEVEEEENSDAVGGKEEKESGDEMEEHAEEPPPPTPLQQFDDAFKEAPHVEGTTPEERREHVLTTFKAKEKEINFSMQKREKEVNNACESFYRQKKGAFLRDKEIDKEFVKRDWFSGVVPSSAEGDKEITSINTQLINIAVIKEAGTELCDLWNKVKDINDLESPEEAETTVEKAVKAFRICCKENDDILTLCKNILEKTPDDIKEKLNLTPTIYFASDTNPSTGANEPFSLYNFACITYVNDNLEQIPPEVFRDDCPDHLEIDFHLSVKKRLQTPDTNKDKPYALDKSHNAVIQKVRIKPQAGEDTETNTGIITVKLFVNGYYKGEIEHQVLIRDSFPSPLEEQQRGGASTQPVQDLSERRTNKYDLSNTGKTPDDWNNVIQVFPDGEKVEIRDSRKNDREEPREFKRSTAIGDSYFKGEFCDLLMKWATKLPKLEIITNNLNTPWNTFILRDRNGQRSHLPEHYHTSVVVLPQEIPYSNHKETKKVRNCTIKRKEELFKHLEKKESFLIISPAGDSDFMNIFNCTSSLPDIYNEQENRGVNIKDILGFHPSFILDCSDSASSEDGAATIEAIQKEEGISSAEGFISFVRKNVREKPIYLKYNFISV